MIRDGFRPTFSAAILNSLSAFCVFLLELDNCKATALSPTVGTAALEWATSFDPGYKRKMVGSGYLDIKFDFPIKPIDCLNKGKIT